MNPPIQLVPQSTDRELATRWLADYAAADVGIEGLVVKPLAGRYEPGRRGWIKVKARHTTEAVAAAVTGDLGRPQHLLLGGLTADGRLRLVGATTRLSAAQRADVAPVLQPPAGSHPWPTELPRGWSGSFIRDRVAITLVEPFVVEVLADLAVDAHRWRHPVRFLRHRPDLQGTDLTPLPESFLPRRPA